MFEFLRKLLTSNDFMPHGHCYLWMPEIVWLHVISDALVALSYTTIPFTLYYFSRKRKDLPFNWMFLCFAVFIVACGATHYMEIWTIWTPVYRLSGIIKAITALVSVPTAILLIHLVPKALAIPSPEQLRQANEQLQRSEAALRMANQELESFSYSVAHELRAPLRGMNGFSRILLDDHSAQLDEAARDHLRQIESNALKMGELIDSLLSLSRTARGPLQIEHVDLSQLATDTASRLTAADAHRKVEIVIEEGLSASFDATLARVLLDNLIGNAWKFSAKNPAARIEVGALDKEGVRTFFVRDNGAGFDMAHAAKLFAPFFRLHSPNDFTGTGIGLATVRRIIQRHGGEIWAEGRVDAGATFYFSLPQRATP